MPTLVVVAAALAAACTSTPVPQTARRLPANVLAQPRGTVGLVLASFNSPTPTALRALGITYRPIPLAQAPKMDLSAFQVLLLDEDALEADNGFVVYDNLIENVRKYGMTLVVMRQRTETLAKAAKVLPFKLLPRDAEYKIVLVTPRRDDPVMNTPNTIVKADLDSLGRSAGQLVSGGPDARAIISANLDAPDSSAALLWEPYRRGSIWYVAVPVSARAATGAETERKLLSNLVSNK